jgi:hypothetical protein
MDEREAKFGRRMGLSQGLLFVHRLGMQAICQQTGKENQPRALSELSEGGGSGSG